jgi:hypothetical protein
MQVIDLSEVLQTFCKQVDLDNLGWTLELSAKFYILNGCIAFVVIELDVDASNCCKWKQSKISTKIWNL